MIPGYYQHDHDNIMAETIFTGEYVKKLSNADQFSLFALPRTIFSWLFKQFFVCDRP